MEIIDAHIHLWRRVPAWNGYHQTPRRAYGRVVINGRAMDMLPPSFVNSTSTAEMAIAHMDRHGVRRAIVVQELLDGFLDAVVIDAVRRFPERFVGESLPDPAAGAASTRRLERRLRAGQLRGIKIPLAGMKERAPGFDLDCPLAFDWFEVCRRHRAFVTIHPTPPAEFVRPMRFAAERFPDVPFLIAHGGLPNLPGWEAVLGLARQPNVFIELAALPYVFREAYPCPRSVAAIERMAAEVGPHKLLWGSDYPRTLTTLTYAQQIEVVSQGCKALAEADRALILGGTAERLLARK